MLRNATKSPLNHPNEKVYLKLHVRWCFTMKLPMPDVLIFYLHRYWGTLYHSSISVHRVNVNQLCQSSICHWVNQTYQESSMSETEKHKYQGQHIRGMSWHQSMQTHQESITTHSVNLTYWIHQRTHTVLWIKFLTHKCTSTQTWDKKLSEKFCWWKCTHYILRLKAFKLMKICLSCLQTKVKKMNSSFKSNKTTICEILQQGTNDNYLHKTSYLVWLTKSRSSLSYIYIYEVLILGSPKNNSCLDQAEQEIVLSEPPPHIPPSLPCKWSHLME